jgi:MoaA/NifB/PqqE/SkfB family radical SAM enzyme
MHVPHVDVGLGSEHIAYSPTSKTLDFLWLELTNRCNLRCVHCYTESHPLSGDRDILTANDYDRLMREAYELGCRKMQFIGPALLKGTADLGCINHNNLWATR